jgi:hypothetical protein
MSHARWLCLALPVLAGACRVYTNGSAGTTRLTAAENLAASRPTVAQSERLSRCPSAVSGATTLVNETPGGVEVRVMASGEATEEIRTRAAALRGAAEETRGEHMGNGMSKARFGRCPVVMRNTTLEVRDIPGGSAIVIKPSHPNELAWLRREVEARSAQLATPKFFGGGLMRTCPSAVPNAETTVTNTPYGVDVKVTEATPAGTRAIRQRAKELAVQGPVNNDRCPLTAPDSTFTVSEVPGGVLIAVKPKRSEDLATLRTTVQERARFYEAPATR